MDRQAYKDAIQALGLALKQLRRRSGMTQEEVAVAMKGLSGKGTASTVTKAETGAHIPGSDSLLAMLIGQGLTLRDFAEAHELHLAQIQAERDPIEEVMHQFLAEAKRDPVQRTRLIAMLHQADPGRVRPRVQALIAELEGNGDGIATGRAHG